MSSSEDGEPPAKRARIVVSGGGVGSRQGSEDALSLPVPAPSSASPAGNRVPWKKDRFYLKSLVDLCLGVMCTQPVETSDVVVKRRSKVLTPPSEFIGTLPQFLRERLNVLFQHDEDIQQRTKYLNYSRCLMLTDEELIGLPFLKNLETLNLSGCTALTALALSHIASLPNLRTLIISKCPNVAMGLAFLRGGPASNSIELLDASFCELQDPVLRFVSSCTNLQNLCLSCNRLSDQSGPVFGQLRQLRVLDVSMNPLITDAALEGMHSLLNLEVLNINFCKDVSSTGLSYLSKALPGLKKIDMNGCDKALTDVKLRPLVLLAEDNKVATRMISMVLNRYNFDVEVAADGAAALELYEKNPTIDLILLDLNMPVMDGLTCLKGIRAFEASSGRRRTPVIIQTADTREEQKEICVAAGCDELIRKPLDRSCISLARQLLAKSEESNPNSRKRKSSS